jgi:HSP20 family protein
MADQEITYPEKQEVAPPRGEFTHEGAYFTPAVDIYETEKELVLLADMPGVDASGVDIDLKDNVLSVVGKVTVPPDTGEPLLAEYKVGNYVRNFSLTDAIDQSGINAALVDGVLKVVLPKAAKAVPRKIPISGE